MKKVIIAVLVIAALFLAFLILVPKAYFSDHERINNISLYKITNADSGEDISGLIDTELLAKSLPLLRSRRLPEGWETYELNRTRYELWCMDDQTPWYIVLGDRSFIYSHSNWSYEVLNADSWIALLDSLTAELEN